MQSRHRPARLVRLGVARVSSICARNGYAVAAVARPAEFFAMLQAHGLSLASTEALPDHFDFDSWKPLLDKHQKLICTEKDAIKLWAQYPEALAVPLQVHLPPAFFAAVDAGIRPWAPDQRGPTAAQ